MIDFDVYAIVDPRKDGAFERALAQLALGPRLALQIRAKGAGAEIHAEAIARLLRPARVRGVELFVSTHLDVAARLGVGVHLPESAPDVEEVRRTFRGPIGVSCHDAAGLARRHAADFAVLGPVHAVPSKGPALGWDAFSALVRASALPIFALGGIDDAGEVRRARASGARGVAVERAFWSTDLSTLLG